MPKALERKLRRQVRKKGWSPESERARAYIYGVLRKTGWRLVRILREAMKQVL